MIDAFRVAFLVLLVGSGIVRADVGATVKQLIENQRHILILREFTPQGLRAEARRAGQFLFFSNQHLSRVLVAEVTKSSQDVSLRYRELTMAMDDPAYMEEDRLVLRAPLEELSTRVPPEESRDVQQRLDALARLRKTLATDFGAAFAHMPLKAGRPLSARWRAYLVRMERLASPEQILADLDHELAAVPEAGLAPSEAAARARVLEWNGEELPDHVVLLTFDDGPHPIHTPAILDVLRANGVHALFFQVGHNLGEVSNGVAKPGANQAIETRLVAEGHAVGNHSYTHPILPKLSNESIVREIVDSQMLLDAMVPLGNARTGGFRPPYGARDDKVLAQIELHHLRSIVWNIDSEDWADPVPESIAHRVVREAENAGRGIVLMHDIHGRTVDALPRIITELGKRGFRFARWDGRQLAVD